MLNPQILTPYDIAGRSLRNRLAVAPMTRVSATETGHATQEMARYYERFSQGGFGLVITEGIYTDQKHSQGYPFQPGITDEQQAQAWQMVTNTIHAHQGAVFAQLMHAGALSQGNRFVDFPAAPSALRPKGEQMKFYYGSGQYPLPRAMTEEDIADAIEGFSQAAIRSIRSAKFDGIEIHGANGYLLDQFLTEYTNRREDRWGGSVQARMYLTLEVVKAVRKAIGAVPVGVRISQSKVNDYEHKWAEGEQAAEVIFGSLSDAGVDFIHVTEFEAWKPAFPAGNTSLVSLSRRYAPQVALIANGGLHTPEHALSVMEEGADIIAIGKAALANPDMPRRLAGNEALDEFDSSILGPIANIKSSELALV
ncbi:NADH:flavin oxidoreductase [Pseudomonas sp. PDM14]|uniref:oxidoreductase n=1 Tax=Pseudomonas sp. PDM14 TaxID=2769288 RepID=UPI0017852CD4|nr:NADH:flavin oxidoreductase [Pseudomonas sp. PDM14]MBD9484035.1 NADH:flavin oxidoreductase [Pseudomonas sp. PDM14]